MGIDVKFKELQAERDAERDALRSRFKNRPPSLNTINQASAAYPTIDVAEFKSANVQPKKFAFGGESSSEEEEEGEEGEEGREVGVANENEEEQKSRVDDEKFNSYRK